MRMAISNVAILMSTVTLASACATDYMRLASESIKQERFEEAVGYLKEGSDLGDARCDYRLGKMMLSGQGIERDTATAEKLLIKAGIEGIPKAQLELARIYARGKIVDKNPKGAVYWYGKAADSGLLEAQSSLGVLYANGEGVEQNLETAAEWYRKAAVAGDPLGQAALGIATFNGMGVPKDIVDGYTWTKLAANQGNEKALSLLPTMEAELTEEELVTAESKVSKFRPKITRVKTRVASRDLRREMGGSARDSMNRRRTGTHSGY